MISLRGREARSPFPPCSTGCERAAVKRRDVTVRRRCQHFPQHPSENTPNEDRGTSATRITDRAPWKKYNPLWALRGNRKCRTEERQPGEGMELITILEKTVSPGESLHHAAHTAGGPGPMPNAGPGGAAFARRRAARSTGESWKQGGGKPC